MSSSTGNLQKYDAHKGKRRITDLSQIAQLPANQHTVMETMLHAKEMSYSRLCETIKHLPDNTRLTQSQIDSTLYELISAGYLTSFMEDGEIIYMVQLKGKSQKRDEQRLWKGLDLGRIHSEIRKKNDKGKKD
jgi:hypothetical protein